MIILIAGWSSGVAGFVNSDGADWAYSSVLPLHTYIESSYIVRRHTQNLLEGSW